MKEIIRLFELKNEYLDKFLSITRTFIMELQNGRLGDVELLRQNRENILDIIEHVDDRMGRLLESCSDLPDSEIEELRILASSAIFMRDNYVTEILLADKELFTLLDAEKAAISEELVSLRTLGNAFAGYGRIVQSS